MEDELIFVSKRKDGLGERLRALVNAMLMSELFSARFKFTWDTKNSDNEFHDTVEPEKIFSDEFNEKFLCSDFEVKDARPVREFFPGSESGGAYFCDQTLPPELFGKIPGLSDYANYRRLWFSAYKKVDFSTELFRIMEEAENLDVGPLDYCIHLRAGDLIYGAYKPNVSYFEKSIPFPVAEELIKRKTVDGTNVLVFGQDLSLIEYLKCKYNVVSAVQFSSIYGLSYERAFFDFCLMSRCSNLIAGSSGFAILASLVGGGKLVKLRSVVNEEEQLNILSRNLVPDKLGSTISDEQISYALKYLLILGVGRVDNRSYGAFLSFARELDPKNGLFDFVAVWFYCKIGDFKTAEICARVFLSDSEKVEQFIRYNLNTSFSRNKLQDWFDCEVFNNAGYEWSEKIYSLIMSNI